MTKQKWQMWDVLFMAVAAAWTVVFFVLALNTYFSDSEIWLLTLSQQILGPHELASVLYKFSFHVVTYLMSHFAPSELGVYLWARTGWAAVAILSVWLTARLFSRVYNQPKWLWPLFVFLLTSSLFLNQGFRVRADIFCLFLHVLYLTIFYDVREREIRRRDFAILTCIQLALLLATPKFIIFTLCQSVLCWSWAQSSAQRKKMIWLLTFTVLGPIALGSALVWAVAIFGDGKLFTSISAAADFFFKSFDPSLVNPLMFSASDFYHFFKLPTRSHTHALVLLIWILGFFVLIFKKKDDTNSPQQAFQLYAALLFFNVIVYNQKLPFFLGTFLTPVLAQAFCFIFSILGRRRPSWAAPVIFLLTIGASANAGFNAADNYFNNSNIPQKQMIERLDNYTDANPHLKIYDIIGLLPRKNKVFVFIGPSEVAQKTLLIEQVLDAKPDILLIVYKFKYFEPEFPPILQKNWVPIGSDVWATGRFISPLVTPHNFSQNKKIGEMNYWLMPYPKERFFLNSVNFKQINSETIALDDKGLVTQTDPVTLAVPENYMSLILTDVEPIGLPYHPSSVFRFDTPF